MICPTDVWTVAAVELFFSRSHINPSPNSSPSSQGQALIILEWKSTSGVSISIRSLIVNIGAAGRLLSYSKVPYIYDQTGTAMATISMYDTSRCVLSVEVI